MITFKNYLSENAYTPSAITDAQFISWCEENAPKYLQKAARAPIFRGFDAPQLGFIDSNKMNRTSANTRNYYTIWMDNDPDWKEFPKRSKSLICSTASGTASGFGEVQLIIPADSNKIGICSANDLWASFEFLTSRLGRKYMSLDDFVQYVDSLFLIIKSKAEAAEAEKNYGALVDCLKSVTLQVLLDAQQSSKYQNDLDAYGEKVVIDTFVRAMSNHGHKNLYDLWRDGMQPEENDFELTTAQSMYYRTDREVWIQGPCCTMSIDKLNWAVSAEEGPLVEFCKKYALQEALSK